jgi:hypothetical protein
MRMNDVHVLETRRAVPRTCPCDAFERLHRALCEHYAAGNADIALAIAEILFDLTGPEALAERMYGAQDDAGTLPR